MANLAEEWASAQPMSLADEWESAKPVKGESISSEKDRILSLKTQEFISDKLVDPLLRYGLAGIGSVIGMGAGSVIPVPGGAAVGALAGGTIGYGMGAQLSDRYKEAMGLREQKALPEVFSEAGQQLKEGALVQGGGQILAGGAALGAKSAGAAWQRVVSAPLGQEAVAKRAGQILSEHTSGGELFAVNEKMAKEIESQVPGLKFTRGQLSNDPQALLLERALVRKGGEGATLTKEHQAYANKALRDYYDFKVAGSGKPDDFVSALAGKQEVVEGTLSKVQKSVNQKVAEYNNVSTPQQGGERILDSARKAKQEKALYFEKEYDKIPNVKLKANNLLEELKGIQKEYNPNFESPNDYPGGMMNRVISKLSPKDAEGKIITDKDILSQTDVEIKFQDIRKLRTQVMKEIRNVQGGANPNDILAGRLKQIQGKIEETLNALEGESGVVAEQYRKVSGEYKKYAKEFKQGTIADILAKGPRGEDSRIATANIAEKFFNSNKVNAADDFIKAIGNDKVAREAIHDYAVYDMMNRTINSSTGQLDGTKLMAWKSKNNILLKKYGMTKEFDDLASLQRQVDVAQKNVDVFNKSIAARILNSDPERIIANMFSGASTKNPAQAASEVMNMVKGNVAAEKGVQKAFGDYIMNRSITTQTDLLDNFTVGYANLTRTIRQYAPAIKEIYKNDPEAQKSLMKIWKAYDILGRPSRPIAGAGSDTVENLASIIASGSAPLVQTSRWAMGVKAITGWLRKQSEDRVNKLLLRATFDPDYANTLMMAFSPQKTKISVLSPGQKLSSTMFEENAKKALAAKLMIGETIEEFEE